MRVRLFALLNFEKIGMGVPPGNHAQGARVTIKYVTARPVDLIG